MNLHINFSSSFPREVTDNAHINSLKSIFPFLSSSNTSNTYSANLVGSPKGKKCLYIF